MLKIILCDADIIYREKLKQMISRILFDKEEVSFECYEDGYELVQILEREDMVYQGYEVRAFAYLLKSQVEEKLENTMRFYLEEQAKNSKQYLLVKKHKRKERIPLKAIKYLVSDKRKIHAVLEPPYESTDFYMRMSEAEECLRDVGFLRCHQSYLVNVHQILYRDGNNLALAGNVKIPVSRGYRKKVNQRFERLTEEAQETL